MTASYSKHNLAPLYPTSVSARLATEEAIRNAGASRRQSGRGIGQRLGRALAVLGSFGHRNAVMNELNSLSERELADIGISRGQIHRVFDADFAAEHRARG